jgi:predicted ATP-grasp superfamily ATP-dependent carboligase
VHLTVMMTLTQMELLLLHKKRMSRKMMKPLHFNTAVQQVEALSLSNKEKIIIPVEGGAGADECGLCGDADKNTAFALRDFGRGGCCNTSVSAAST